MDATQLRSWWSCHIHTVARGHQRSFSTIRRMHWVYLFVLSGLFGTFANTSSNVTTATAAQYATPNFVIQTEDATLAKQFAETAEASRKQLTMLWLGHNIPNWSRPCPVRVKVDERLGAGGETSFSFAGGEVYGWTMSIQGPADQIINSVLPHEITHMILASHFRKPLPRWADEGAASAIEDASERQKLNNALIKYLQTNRGISFTRMFAMKEYPDDIRPLYAQAHALVTFLIDQGGHRKYIQFLETAFQNNHWDDALQSYYGFDDLKTLQTRWNRWVAVGMPLTDGTLLAANAPLVGHSLTEQTTTGKMAAGQNNNPVRPVAATDIASNGVTLASYTLENRPNTVIPANRSVTATSANAAAPSNVTSNVASNGVTADPYGGTRTAAARPRPEPNLVWNGPVEDENRSTESPLECAKSTENAQNIPVQGPVTGSISSSSAVVWNTSNADSQVVVRELLSQARTDAIVR